MKRAAVLAILVVALSTASAPAELAQKGDLFVHFGGGVSPKQLPRDSLAPIGVRIEGRIRVPAGHEPPALHRIEVALNRGGHLSSRGLPTCRRRRIASATPAEALATCGRALVGTGGLTASTSFPSQAAYLLRGETLLFNARMHGHPAILAYVFQRRPTPLTRFIVFRIRHSGGRFGTLISGDLSAATDRNANLRSIYLQLQRNYVFHGHRRSYISAGCAIPPGVPVASFPFARVSMSFEDGRTLSSTLFRTCRAR